MFKINNFLVVSCFTLSLSAFASKLDKDGILRKSDGSLQLMSHDDATDACPDGTHLPNVRELAKIAQELGAKGILETSDIKDGVVPEGYTKICGKSGDRDEDEFYYNYNGYKRPAGDLGKNWFWSSSRVGCEGTSGAFNLNGEFGFIMSDDTNESQFYYTAIRCIKDPQSRD